MGEAQRLTYENTDGSVWSLDFSVEGPADYRETGQLVTSISSGLVSRTIDAREDLKPTIVYNDHTTGQSVLSRIEDELRSLQTGDEFRFAVAFINKSGLNLLLMLFDELRERGVRGKVLTGTYLAFNDPQAFQTLLDYSDMIETRVFDETEHNGLHTKGYYFRRGNFVNILVGSSNLTASALKGNLEWNLAVSSTTEGSLVDRFEEAFDLAWNSPTCKPLTPAFCESYARFRNEIRAQGIVPLAAVKTGPIEPNAMQAEALGNLALCREEGKPRALVISATGTGKTYLAALDVKQAAPERVLFVVHRERIAIAARNSFERVLGDRYTYGLYGGGHRDTDATCLFSTVQTLSRPENLAQFEPDEFDYVIFDEVHRAGAPGYQRLFAHFEPAFLLGMSATPERSDSFDIFEMFDHVVAYEIRLQGALENHLITPFQYFGVSTLDGTDSDARTSKDYQLEAEEIARQSRKYGYSGPRLKGLIFCSRLQECEEVSAALNELGYRTVALTGGTSDADREEAMARLEQNEPDDALDFILTVDIFNEGIDIPTVNQVIMVRPTESAIVFVQQLGRGLRTCAEKEYVTIIDFVSNYSKNYNIPIALNGNRTLQKEELRHLVAADGSHIPGNTTIQFDRIARQRVLKSINETNFSKAAFFRGAYVQLKRRLGRIPTLEEFREWGEASPYLILNSKSSFGSYHEFLAKHEGEYQVEFSDAQRTMLKFVCGEIADGKRPSDLIAVRALMEGPTNVIAIAERIATWDKLAGIVDHNLDLFDEAFSAVNLLCLDFLVSTARNKNIPLCTAADNNGDVTPSAAFAEACKDEEFSRQLNEVIDYGLRTCELEYGSPFGKSRLNINARYSRKDASRLLNWKKNEEGTINGYIFRDNDWVIFVTHDKSADIAESTKYGDHFVTRDRFVWYSQSNRSLMSKDYEKLSSFDPASQRIHLFVKKGDSEGTEHYYLGTVRPQVAQITEERQPDGKGGTSPILRVPFILDREVSMETYHYLRG